MEENNANNGATSSAQAPAIKSRPVYEPLPPSHYNAFAGDPEIHLNPLDLHPSGKRNFELRLTKEQSCRVTERNAIAVREIAEEARSREATQAQEAIQAREAFQALKIEAREGRQALAATETLVTIQTRGIIKAREITQVCDAIQARLTIRTREIVKELEVIETGRTGAHSILPQLHNPFGIHSSGKPNYQVRISKDQSRQLAEANAKARNTSGGRAMNYPNYADSPGAGPVNSRQAPPSPSQAINHTNGMNGGGMGGMVGYPTPAGHQSDLNYVMSLVEELSQTLHQNQQMTAAIVEKVGKVRDKAKNMNLTNDELVAVVAAEMNEDSKNLEKENSELRKALETTEYDRKENYKLACHGANILADILEKMHRYKEQHERDTCAWHQNYRDQLAQERKANDELQGQINDMRAAAYRASEHLRAARRCMTDSPELNELRTQVQQYRQEKRYWKRMACPLIPDDDSEWSDDDDLIDPEEKKRLAMLQAEKERKEKEEAEGVAPQT